MTDTRAKIAGVVLAGGQARRMGGSDKGLVSIAGKTLVEYALCALRSVVDETIINANRNHLEYERFGYPVVADASSSFDGPLAGILSAMRHCNADYLLTVPCDCPLMDSSTLQTMVAALDAEPAECLVANDGVRLHPVVLLLDCRLQNSLEGYLASGERKIDRWFKNHHWRSVDFSDRPDVFRNINTPEELVMVEKRFLGNNGTR